jgi:hypothetical protein
MSLKMPRLPLFRRVPPPAVKPPQAVPSLICPGCPRCRPALAPHPETLLAATIDPAEAISSSRLAVAAPGNSSVELIPLVELTFWLG